MTDAEVDENLALAKTAYQAILKRGQSYKISSGGSGREMVSPELKAAKDEYMYWQNLKDERAGTVRRHKFFTPRY